MVYNRTNRHIFVIFYKKRDVFLAKMAKIKRISERKRGYL